MGCQGPARETQTSQVGWNLEESSRLAACKNSTRGVSGLRVDTGEPHSLQKPRCIVLPLSALRERYLSWLPLNFNRSLGTRVNSRRRKRDSESAAAHSLMLPAISKNSITAIIRQRWRSGSICDLASRFGCYREYGRSRRACRRATTMMQELSLSDRRLGKDLLGLLLKYAHRADVWDRTIADARDAEPGETFIRWHAVHDHDIHRQRDSF